MARRSTLAAAAIAATALVGVVAFALAKSIDLPTVHIDGAYQNASALDRLAAGQLPGRDFLPYLGLGPVFVTFAILLATGSDLAATVTAAHIANALSFAAPVGIVAFLVAPRTASRVPMAVALGSLAVGLAVVWHASLPYFYAERLLPGFSMRPLRAMAPYLAVAASYAALTRPWREELRFAMAGAVAGLTAWWSNDFGPPTAAVLSVFAAGLAWRVAARPARAILSLALAAMLTGVMVPVLATGGHLVEFLRFNLAVSREQYWYFGLLLPSARVFTPGDLVTKFLPLVGPWALVLPAAAIVAILRPSLERGLLVVLGLALFGGGAVAMIGGSLLHYMGAFVFWCQLTFALGVACLVLTALARLPAVVRALPRVARAAMVAALAVTALLAMAAIVDLAERRSAAAADPQRFRVDELGGYLPVAYRGHIGLARSLRDATMAEEYWGLWGALTRRHSPWPVDSVIHAFGDVRERATQRMREPPDVVVTTPYSHSPDFQPWNFSRSYWLYQPLLDRYDAVLTSPTTLTWRPGKAREWTPAACAVVPGTRPSLVVTAAGPGYYEVTLDYAIDGSRRAIMLVQNGINFAGWAGGYLALDPRGRRIVFPVLSTAAGAQVFGTRFLSAPDAVPGVTFAGCSARRIPRVHPEVMPFTDAPEPIPPEEAAITGGGVNPPRDGWVTGWLNGTGLRKGDQVVVERTLLQTSHGGDVITFAIPESLIEGKTSLAVHLQRGTRRTPVPVVLPRP